MPDKHYLVFPLGGVVLFPGMLMPLHIFEPRYKALLERSLNEDGMITMALVRPDQKRENEEHESVFKGLISKEAMLLQPFQKNIVEIGEVSFMVFGGKYSHAVLKKAFNFFIKIVIC